ncbi:MAG: polysaccharide biosynthesis tyrosine autokinase [Clostridia bacterium]|nr:polysaccharide biosynthesis tyrosine autokinase [Clostridia bacterium]
MTYEKTMYEENESGIEIMILLRCVLDKWKAILACGLICALIGVIFAAVTYVPSYTSTISYVINSKSSTNDSTLNPNDFVVAEYLANTYSYVIKSHDFIQRIKAETGIDEDIKKFISSTLVESSSIMKVVVRSEDADKTYKIASAISLYLPEKAKETVHSASLDALESPLPPVIPDANNNIFKMGALGLILGALLAAAVVVVLQLLKKTVMTPNVLTDKIDISLIGSVPHVDINKKKGKNAAHEPMLVTNKKTGFVFSETYKSMRTKIERFSKKNNCKAILVTSAMENEGKTTVGANIAISLAQNGNKVLMLDCDLRKPAVATVVDAKDMVRIPAIDVISGKADVKDAIVNVKKYNIDIIGGLKAVGNSSEILSTQGLKKVIDILRENYDYIIVDTPPSQLFTDAAIISEYTDAGILVVRQNSANLDDVISVVNDISQSNAEIIGFVFNNVSDTSILPGGYSKKYNYSYYGYGRND